MFPLFKKDQSGLNSILLFKVVIILNFIKRKNVKGPVALGLDGELALAALELLDSRSRRWILISGFQKLT